MFQPPSPPHNIDENRLFNTIKFIDTPNYSIAYLIVLPANNKTPTKYMIFSHGNACDLFGMYEFAKFWANKLNIAVVLYDYPGYGVSNGKPTEQGCYESLTGIVAEISKIVNIKDITLVGQSIGTGVVVDQIANNKSLSGAILISPYTSVVAIASDMVSSSSSSLSSTSTFLSTPIDKFCSLKKIKNVECPVKIFHGNQDNVINVSHGKELYDKLPNKKFSPVWMEGVDHNNILSKIDLNDIREVIYG